jgi:hypothetical protein
MSYTLSLYRTGALTQFSGGLMAWNVNKQTTNFFARWAKEWNRYRHRDQGALTRALAQMALKIWTLEYQANAKKRSEAIEVWHRHGEARRKGAQ